MQKYNSVDAANDYQAAQGLGLLIGVSFLIIYYTFVLTFLLIADRKEFVKTVKELWDKFTLENFVMFVFMVFIIYIIDKSTNHVFTQPIIDYFNSIIDQFSALEFDKEKWEAFSFKDSIIHFFTVYLPSFF